MNLTSNRISLAHSLIAFTAVSLLASCNGGGDLFGVITPIDGQWVSESGVSISFDESNTTNRFLNRSYELSANLDDSASLCGLDTSNGDRIQFEAVYDEGNVEFYIGEPENGELCLRGVFTNLVTLKVETVQGDSFDVFTNSRVAVGLEIGMWESSDNNVSDNKVEIIFFDPPTVDNNSSRDASGCVRFNGTDVESVMGRLFGYDTVEQKNPYMESMSSGSTGDPVFNSITFVDVFTLSLVRPDGSELTLNRVKELPAPFYDPSDVGTDRYPVCGNQ